MLMDKLAVGKKGNCQLPIANLLIYGLMMEIKRIIVNELRNHYISYDLRSVDKYFWLIVFLRFTLFNLLNYETI